jgi:mitogen-activated protein kinase organizer 1
VRKLQGHSHRINSVCINDDSTLLFTASYDKTVRVWDLRSQSRDPVQTMEHFTDSVTSVACTAYQIVAACVDGGIRTYDLRAGLMHCDSGVEPVTHISLTEDHKCVLASCIGGVNRLYDLSSGKILQSYRGHGMERYKSEGGVTASTVEVVGGSEDGRVVMWSLVTAKLMTDFVAHSKGVSSLSCHPSNRDLLLTASYDGGVALWKLPTISG